MTEITDMRVKDLLLVIRNRDSSRYIESQLAALHQLKQRAKDGNSDARTALHHLTQVPDLPPQLQQLIRD